ncbi:MAG TPA: hypothetical protein VLX92_26660 [Kofleriaceae bacterium]|nr:hypothetical protein [Kofleriaceae bacterium]
MRPVPIAIVVALASRAFAGGADFQPPPANDGGKDIVITTEGERSTRNIAVLASIAGAGALLGGVGLYFHLDARSAADQVSADQPTGQPWTPADQTAYDRAHSSSVKAAVFYSLGGAALIGAVVGLIVTAPSSETTVIHPHRGTATFAPAPGGAVVGGVWSF